MVNKSLSSFSFLIIAFSLPFWLIGYFFKDLFNFLPINLPVSSLMILSIPLAVFILVYKEEKWSGIRKLLTRIGDFKLIKSKIWYLPALFLMPAVTLLTYLLMLWFGLPLPKLQLSVSLLVIFFGSFLMGAVLEEVGWTGYATDLLQKKQSALATGIIIGIAWALWHIIPYIQANHDYWWIIGQCLTTIFARIMIVWIYNNAGQSLVLAILFHTMLNVSEFSFPNLGSHYNPLITAGVMAIMVVLITFFWGAKKLAKFRY